MIFVGIDVGTTGVKVVAISPEGDLLREQTQRYPIRMAAGGGEQDAMTWWRSICDIAGKVVDGDEVASIAVTSQAPTIVPVDSNGRPTSPAMTWVDRRAFAEARILADALGDAAGERADPYYATSRLLWAAENTDYLARATTALSANGFIARMVTGQDSLDESTAGLYQGWDGEFDPRLAAVGVPVDMFPAVVRSDALIGHVTAAAAEASGLPAGVPVLAGAIDGVGAALEAGVLGDTDGDVEMTGFSTALIRAVPRGTRAPGIIHTRHSIAEVDLLIASQNTTGSALEWLVRLTGMTLGGIGELPSTRPGRIRMIPSFAGERTPTWDPHATATITGLDLAATAEDLLLAHFEGTAMLLRECREIMGGERSRLMRSIGGGAKSAEWLQIKADVLGAPVIVPTHGHGAAVGAALLAALEQGAIDKQFIRDRGRSARAAYEPNLGRHARYTDRLAELQQLRSAVHDIRDQGSTTPAQPFINREKTTS